MITINTPITLYGGSQVNVYGTTKFGLANTSAPVYSYFTGKSDATPEYADPSYGKSMTTCSDGTILIGGCPGDFYGTNPGNLFKINADGTLSSSSFNSNVGIFTSISASTIGAPSEFGIINAILEQSDGKILVGGAFRYYNSDTRYKKLIRFNANGTLDTTFTGRTTSSIEITSGVNCLIEQPDGKILIGGVISSYSGSTVNGIVRINPSGSIDATFATSGAFGANGKVSAMVLQPDGKILVGGSFTSYSGSTTYGTNNTIYGLLRLNSSGSIDTTFAVSSSVNLSTNYQTIRDIVVQPDGKIIVCGAFTSYSGSTTTGIIRLTPSGSLDPDFKLNFDTSEIFVGDATSANLVSNGKIVFTGDVGSSNNYYYGILRLDSSGSLDYTYGYLDEFGSGSARIDYAAWSAIKVGGDSILAYGNFALDYTDLYQGGIIENSTYQVGGLTLKNSDGTTNENFILNSNGGITTFYNFMYTMKKQSDGKILVSSYGGTYLNGNEYYVPANSKYQITLYRLNQDLSVDSSFSSSIKGGIEDIIEQQDGKILIVGSFTTASGYESKGIARLNRSGSLDPDFYTNAGISASNSQIYTAIQQSDGKIVLGGSFTGYSGSAVNRIVRINLSGSIDPDFNIGTGFVGGDVRKIIQQSDGKLVIGGSFTAYNGVGANRIIRLNLSGSRDPDFSPGTGFNSSVYAIYEQPDKKLMIGGLFTSYNGTGSVTPNTVARIVRLQPSGAIDTSYVCGVSTDAGSWINDIQRDPYDRYILVGSFTQYSGSIAGRIAVTTNSGALDPNFKSGVGFYSGYFTETNKSEITNDGNILVFGSFSAYSQSFGYRVNPPVLLSPSGSTIQKTLLIPE